MLLQKINAATTDLYQKDFLLTWEKTGIDVETILAIANVLQDFRYQNISARCFDSGLAVSQFRDNSTPATRFSFVSAANMLGLTVQDLDELRPQNAGGETVRDTSVMISYLSDIIGIRDDRFPGNGNAYMQTVGKALDEAYAAGLLPQRPGIINLQSDIDHPTQSMADLMHLENTFGSLQALRGKKLAMTWAYSPGYDKSRSVPQGIIGLMTRVGMQVDLAYPEGYELLPEVVELAGSQAQKSGGSFRILNSMDEAFRDADIVYPINWAPLVMEQKTEPANFKDWECTEEKMKLTKEGKAVYMHSLPADITGVSCAEGEVTAPVFERYSDTLYKQAGYKPYIIAAMMLGNRFEKPAKVLERIFTERKRRVL